MYICIYICIYIYIYIYKGYKLSLSYKLHDVKIQKLINKLEKRKHKNT